MIRHRVARGEHLVGIAARYGIASWKRIWNLAENQGLRELRKDPNVLLPGDVVIVPEVEQETHPAQSERRSEFRVKRPRLLLRIDTRDLPEHAAGSALWLELDGGERRALQSAGPHLVEAEIPVDATGATLWAGDAAIPLRIGDLDPVDSASGQRERLRNLGYLDTSLVCDAETLASAVLAFQQDYDLLRDGICGPQTKRKLLEVHGS